MKGDPSRVLIVGLGNELLSDDGVGVHACRLLQREAADSRRPAVTVAEIGTAVMDSLHLLQRADLIVAIDAMYGDGPPGSLYLAAADDLEQDRLAGLHELSLLGALRMVEDEARGRHLAGDTSARSLRRPQVDVLGVEPASLGLGLSLSPAVTAALPQVAAHAWRRVERWLDTPR